MNLKVNDNIVPNSGLGRIVSISSREIVVEFKSTMTDKIINKKFNAEMAEKMGLTFDQFMTKFFCLVEIKK